MVDIIIALLLAAGAYLGYKRGLIMQIFYLGTIIIGYVVSMLFSSRLAYLFTSMIPIPTDVTDGLEGIYKGLNIPTAYYRIVSFIVLFIIGVCISFNGVVIIAKNTDIRLDFSGEKDFFVHLTDLGWIVSIFLIIVGGVMVYFSYIELMPYIVSTLEVK